MQPLRLAAASLAAAASIGIAGPAAATGSAMHLSWVDKCDRTVDLTIVLKAGPQLPTVWTVDIDDDGKPAFPVQVKANTETVKVSVDADKLKKVTATRPKTGPIAGTETVTATYPGWKQPRGCAKPCVAVVHTDTKDVTTTAGGVAELMTGGIKIQTDQVPDKVTWKRTLPTPVKMWQVTGLGYTNTKLDDGKANAAALVAYHVYLKVPTKDGIVDATLVYEPYYQITGNPDTEKTATWDVLAGKFWSNKTIPGVTAEAGGSYAGNKTWKEIAKANPWAHVVGFGWGQGTYNAGTISTLSQPKGGAAITFKSTVVSECHDWTKPKPPATTAPATPVTTKPPVAGESLPVTGIKVSTMVAFGALLIGAAGAIFGLLWLTRRRHTA